MTDLNEVTIKTSQRDPTTLNRAFIRYIDISSIDRITKQIVGPELIAVDKAPSRARKLISTNDVLVSTVRPNLNAVARVPAQYNQEIASTGFCVLRANPKLLDATYLFYFVQSEQFVERLTELSTGAGYPAVSDADILDAEIPLPTLPEQQRLAALLDKADHLRRTRRYAQQLSDTFLQSVFLEMFGEQGSNKMGFPIDALGEDVAAFEGGINFNPISEGQAASTWRVLKISAVTSGVFDPQESKPISPSSIFDSSIVVRKGDLIISRANTTELVGAVCMVRDAPPPVILPDKLWRIRFHADSRLLPDYTLFALRQPYLRKIIGDLATGSSGSMKNISKDKAETLPLMHPPLTLQQQFAQIVGRVERLRAQQREAARQAEHLFQTLLHRAFRGEV